MELASSTGLPLWLHALAMLALVLALIGALGWLLRRWEAGDGLVDLVRPRGLAVPQQGWRVVRRLQLTPQHSLIEIEDGTTRLTLLLGPQGGTAIGQLSSQFNHDNNRL